MKVLKVKSRPTMDYIFANGPWTSPWRDQLKYLRDIPYEGAKLLRSQLYDRKVEFDENRSNDKAYLFNLLKQTIKRALEEFQRPESNVKLYDESIRTPPELLTDEDGYVKDVVDMALCVDENCFHMSHLSCRDSECSHEPTEETVYKVTWQCDSTPMFLHRSALLGCYESVEAFHKAVAKVDGYREGFVDGTMPDVDMENDAPYDIPIDNEETFVDTYLTAYKLNRKKRKAVWQRVRRNLELFLKKGNTKLFNPETDGNAKSYYAKLGQQGKFEKVALIKLLESHASNAASEKE